jgi:hypothetical protein
VALVIPYVKQTWTDGVSACSAARNNVHEDGINDAHYQPCVRVTKAAAQTGILSATVTKLVFDTERFDTAGNVASTMHDNVTNNTRLTCRHAGKYEITGQVEWSASPANGILQIFLNDTTEISQTQVLGDYRCMVVATIWDLAVNDFVELRVYQGSGGTLSINKTASRSPEFMMHRVG